MKILEALEQKLGRGGSSA